MSDSITSRCLTELGRIKKASSAKTRARAAEKWQKCLINVTDNKAKTGLKLTKKQKKKLKEGKKI